MVPESRSSKITRLKSLDRNFRTYPDCPFN